MKKIVKETSKKIALGALAILATIGSVSAAPASITMTNGEDFEITAESAGTIPVKGYQTAKSYNYELNVSWGSMEFIFDRGEYNPNTDKLTKKIRTNGYQYCEAGIDGGDGIPTTAPTSGTSDGTGVGKWCGFDGTKNRVDVLNKGNGNVRMTVSCVESSAASAPMSTDGVDMQIGVISTDIGPSADNWVMPTGADATYTANMQDGSSAKPQMTFAKNSGAPVTALIGKKFNLDGTEATQDLANAVKFYLNITGTPSQGTTVDAADNAHLDTYSTLQTTGSNAWEQIGTINLNFLPQSDSEATNSI